MTTTFIRLPYLEDTGLDGKKLIYNHRVDRDISHYTKRIYNVDIKLILMDDTVPPANPGIRKSQKSDETSSGAGAGPSAIEIINKGEFNTDPDIIKTDKLIQLDREYWNTAAVETSYGQNKKLTRRNTRRTLTKPITLEKNCDFKDINKKTY